MHLQNSSHSIAIAEVRPRPDSYPHFSYMQEVILLWKTQVRLLPRNTDILWVCSGRKSSWAEAFFGWCSRCVGEEEDQNKRRKRSKTEKKSPNHIRYFYVVFWEMPR